MSLERVVRPAGPFSLAQSLKHASDATRYLRDETLTTTLRVGSRVEVGSVSQLVDGRVVLRAQTEDGLERLRFVVPIDADHTEFLRRFARDPLLGATTQQFQGMRQLRLPTVAQAFLRAFCGQLIDSRHARELEVKIVRAIAPRIEGTTLREPPTSAMFARLAPVRLRQLGLHARRAAALVRICRATDVERLHELPTERAAAFIERERGLGPWSAGVICLEGLGRHERGLVGDLSLIKLMSRLRGRWVEGWETAELLAPYGEWAGLASVYLATAFKHGLMPLPAERPVRFPRPAYT
ncbi:MAG: DNA-3-methyladenine glycosylase family protein [Gaiellaceae bacterium]